MLDEVRFLSLEAEAADCCIAVVTHAGRAPYGAVRVAWMLRRYRVGADEIVLLCSPPYQRGLPVPCRLLRWALEFIEGSRA